MVMKSKNVKWLVALGAGIAGGWAARSLADTPEGAGVKLLEIAMKAKERIGQWAAIEGERLEDMLAEARSKVEPDVSRPNRATNKSGRKGQSRNKRGTRLVKIEDQA
jgi:hypothetical protein